MLEDQKAEAQKVLDQLWNERLIPFTLTVGRMTKDLDGYTIYFHDSRIRTAEISLSEGQPFTDGLRAAVLDLVAKMSGRLKNWHPEKATAKISS